jgi:hypothetical protein
MSLVGLPCSDGEECEQLARQDIARPLDIDPDTYVRPDFYTGEILESEICCPEAMGLTFGAKWRFSVMPRLGWASVCIITERMNNILSVDKPIHELPSTGTMPGDH